MPPKRNHPLRDQQGLAMILVLCLGALFVALAAALVYAASLMMANADRQLPEQDVYELAVSFSDVLEQELLHYTGAKEKDGAMTETRASATLSTISTLKKALSITPTATTPTTRLPCRRPRASTR